MTNPSPQKIAFRIEIRRVLEILSNDIYDSPYSLLRENIQNAYDAVLMRQESDGKIRAIRIWTLMAGIERVLIFRGTGKGEIYG